MSLKDWIQIGITLAGMLLGPYFAVWLSLRQFHRQKWWEKREKLYTQLLENLSVMKFRTAYNLQGEYQGQSRSEATDPEVTAATEQLKRCLEFGSYLLSEESTKALRNVFAADGDSAVEFYEARWKAIKKAIESVREEACLEVKPKMKAVEKKMGKGGTG